MCWYCCPPGKYVTRVRKKNNGGGNYHEVVNAEHEEGCLEHDPNAVKETLCFDDAGTGHMQAGGKWPMSGSGAACDV